VTLQVSVIGTNYMGATHAAGMAEFGHEVIGIDIDVDRVKTLNAGQSHIFEVGLEPLLERHTASGRLRFTTDYAEIADWADVHFLALGTPSDPGGAADLSQLHAANQADVGGWEVHSAGRHGEDAGGSTAQLRASWRRC
jgi:UDPglucose 6-dehydrogenase